MKDYKLKGNTEQGVGARVIDLDPTEGNLILVLLKDTQVIIDLEEKTFAVGTIKKEVGYE